MAFAASGLESHGYLKGALFCGALNLCQLAIDYGKQSLFVVDLEL
jgi:hypothetical protein